ncbi:MAG TPA: cation diffusion facilitator family transporter [Solirubrobacteraceae bacterium]|jgi:cation diffusion facilitator family transporter|nr:cation diffusion facilitator family transporter [Solirubrobacteraceae bacterium]
MPRLPLRPQTTPDRTRTRAKARAAVVSIVSNTSLIAVKLAAGLLTGSVGILSDAAHSLMDLLASVIAFASVRKSDEPADATHRYGHEKLEDLAAGAQALLLLLGAAFIAFEAIRRLVDGGKVTSLGLGVIVAGLAAATNLVVSTYVGAAGRTTGSAALGATAVDLRTDAIVSLGVLVSLALVALTGASWLDPVTGLAIATAISTSGVRILLDSARRLVDEALPADELAQLHAVVGSFLGDEVVGFHDLRARHVGSNHQVDLHLQFVAGTSLERAHAVSHRLQDAIVDALPATTVLVHLEPQDRVRPDRFGDPDTVPQQPAST